MGIAEDGPRASSIQKVADLADLADSGNILGEAIQYRALDRNLWA
jgi:hypothetical protein